MNGVKGSARLAAYLEQLREEYGGGGWYGESFIDKLNSLDEETVFTQPAPGRHSVAELLAHVTYWRTVLVKYIEGDREYRDRTVETMDFRRADELRTIGWKRLYDSFCESQQTLLSLLESKDDAFLDRDYVEGKTFDRIVRGVVHHDIYHLGQIGFVLALLNRRK